jgi:hypothetical protein
MTATQPRVPGRLMTLDPFELGSSCRESVAYQTPLELGCVDWYLYPVNRKAVQTGGSRSAPRGGAAVPSRRSPPP